MALRPGDGSSSSKGSSPVSSQSLDGLFLSTSQIEWRRARGNSSRIANTTLLCDVSARIEPILSWNLLTLENILQLVWISTSGLLALFIFHQLRQHTLFHISCPPSTQMEWASLKAFHYVCLHRPSLLQVFLCMWPRGLGTDIIFELLSWSSMLSLP